MTPDPSAAKAIRKVHYFDGEVLDAADFRAEQQYFIDLLRAHDRWLHTYGIAGGLTVTAGADRRSLVVRRGLAVDREGREVVLAQDRLVTGLPQGAGRCAVTIAYAEELAGYAAAAAVPGYKRIAAVPAVACTTGTPPEAALVLAEVVLDAAGYVTQVDGGMRRYAGLDVSEVVFSTASTKGEPPVVRGFEEDGAFGLRFEARQTGFFGSVRVAGAVGVGTNVPAAALDVAATADPVARVTFGAGLPALAVRRDGRVGVGTETPLRRLFVAGGDLRLDAGREVFFPDEGGVTNEDRTLGLVFRRKEDVLELRSAGRLLFDAGAEAGDATFTMTVAADGNVGIGTEAPAWRLTVAGIIQSTEGGFRFPDGQLQKTAAAVYPIGTILNWWCPQPGDGGFCQAYFDEIVPDGFAVCNGSTVTDQESPLFGQTLPDFSRPAAKFVLGTASYGEVGEEGGADEHRHVYVLKPHQHGIPHRHAVSGSAQSPASRDIDPQGKDRFGEQATKTDHSHDIVTFNTGYPDSGGTSGDAQYVEPEVETGPAPQVPPFVYLLKIMRIK